MAYDPVVYSNNQQTRTWTTTGGALGVVGEVDDFTYFRNSSGNITGWGWTPRTPAPIIPLSPAAVSTSTGVNPTETSYSLYGHTVPLSVFGVGRIGGEIISGPWIENGLASFIISFGVPANPSGTRILREIAFDSDVVWTGSLTGAGTPATTGFSTESFTVRFYDGTLTQAADALETAHFGADAVAYRPQILLAFENLPLANTKFKKIPYVAAVIADTHGDDVNLGEAFERLAYSPWVGFTSAQFETVGITDGLVSGGLIIADQSDFLSTIQAFGRFYPKWSILQTDKLRIVDRGDAITPDIVLDGSRIMGSADFIRQEPNSAPSVLTLSTIDPDADYTIVPSTAQSPRDPVAVTTSVATDSAYLPVIMNSDTRISIVTYAKHHEDRTRKQVSVTAMIYGLQTEPGDLMAIANLSDDFPGGETFRVLETLHGANYVVQITAEAILRCAVGSLTNHPQNYANFDPSTAIHTAVTNNNLTATSLSPGSGGVLVFASEAKSTGKFYFEMQWILVGGPIFGGELGIASTTASVNDLKTATNSTVMYQGAPIYANGVSSGYSLAALADGDVIGIAVDLINKKVWFKNVTTAGPWNGTVANGNPATNVNGVSIPSGTVIPAVGFGLSNDICIGNFGATAFVGTVPAGFTSGWAQ